MADEKTPPDLNALVDEMVDEQVKTTGLTPEVIKDAVQRERASRAAKRIADKIERAGTASHETDVE